MSEETYNEFYKTTFSDFMDPLAHVHFNVEVGQPERHAHHTHTTCNTQHVQHTATGSHGECCEEPHCAWRVWCMVHDGLRAACVTQGTIEFSSILYIPGMAPFDQQSSMSQKSRSIKLYVKRVFISDEFDDDLMPRCDPAACATWDVPVC